MQGSAHYRTTAGRQSLKGIALSLQRDADAGIERTQLRPEAL
jgi:hypothetical protein